MWIGDSVRNLHISHNAHDLPSKFCISIVSNAMKTGNEKQSLCKILGGKINDLHYGRCASGTYLVHRFMF